MAELGEKPASKPYGAPGKVGLGTGNAGSGYKVSYFCIFCHAFFLMMKCPSVIFCYSSLAS